MPPMEKAMAALSGVKVLNLLDEALLSEVERHGEVADECVERLARLIGLGVEAGSAAIMTTCTVYSPVVADIAGRFAPVPVLAVDQPMVSEALRLGRRIGVLATVQQGLREQMAFIDRTARLLHREVEIVGRLCPGAFPALVAGDAARHDALVLDAIADLAGEVDVVVLGQASMARLLEVRSGIGVPMLASPPLGVRALARLLGMDDAASERAGSFPVGE